MCMKTTPPESARDPGQATEAFDKLPAKTKELLVLQDRIEKTTGRESAALQKEAREKSDSGAPRS